MPTEAKRIVPDTTKGAVITKAALNAARELGFSQKDLATTLGISGTSVSRMHDGQFILSGKPYELALCLIRIFRSLDAITGGDATMNKAWIANHNLALDSAPKTLMLKLTGLIDVMNYLDTARAPT